MYQIQIKDKSMSAYTPHFAEKKFKSKNDVTSFLYSEYLDDALYRKVQLDLPSFMSLFKIVKIKKED